MQLTPHFSLAEMTVSQEAARRGIDNTPDEKTLGNLRVTAEMLEEVRRLLGRPILVTSGYRSPALNKAVGGVWNSAHVFGQAADFHCPSFGPPVAVWREIERSGIKFDQAIYEFGSWVHLAWAEQNRRQVFQVT